MKIYCDNILLLTQNIGVSGISSFPVVFGMLDDDTNRRYVFGGELSYFRSWTNEFTEQEIKLLYNQKKK